MSKVVISHSLVVTMFFTLAWCCALPGLAAPGKNEPISDASAPTVIFPKASFGPNDLAVVVNDADPLSVEISLYYKTRRGIPDGNMIHVSFTPGSTVMTQTEFARIKATVDAKTPP